MFTVNKYQEMFEIMEKNVQSYKADLLEKECFRREIKLW